MLHQLDLRKGLITLPKASHSCVVISQQLELLTQTCSKNLLKFGEGEDGKVHRKRQF